jgi:shikimate kinase
MTNNNKWLKEFCALGDRRLVLEETIEKAEIAILEMEERCSDLKRSIDEANALLKTSEENWVEFLNEKTKQELLSDEKKEELLDEYKETKALLEKMSDLLLDTIKNIGEDLIERGR